MQDVSCALAVVSCRVVVLPVLLKTLRNLHKINQSIVWVQATYIFSLVAIDRGRLVANLHEMIKLVKKLFTRRVDFSVSVTHRFVKRLMSSDRCLEVFSIRWIWY